MKDFLGNELFEDDEIIYVKKTGFGRHQAKLTVGKITEICEKILKVNNDKGYIRPENVLLMNQSV